MNSPTRKKSDLPVLIICTVALLILIVAGYVNEVLIFYGSEPYRRTIPVEPKSRLEFQYTDATELLGPPVSPEKNYNRPGDKPQGVYVADINNDGNDDILYLYQIDDGPNKAKLLLNKRQKGFANVTESSGLLSLLGDDSPVAASIADFNNDGFEDLILTFESKRVTIAFGNGREFAKSRSLTLFPEMGDARTITLLDHDNDGFLDIYLGSYHTSHDRYHRREWERDTNCGLNILIRNIQGKKFEVADNLFPEKNTRCTYATIASDIDGDGYMDLWVPANHGLDQILKNNGGREFTDITREALGYLRSNSSMGIGLADLFGEGTLSAYVTNTDKNLGLKFGMGSLWYNRSQPGKFSLTDIGIATKTDQCGHSWGALFIDPDRNGYPDLFVTNAVTRNVENFWNLNFYHAVMANALRKFVKYGPFFHTPRMRETAAPCFFRNTGKPKGWRNIVDSVGLEKIRGGRSVAVFDYNLDGQEDILVGSLYSGPSLWRGNYEGDNKWLGVRLTGTKSNRSAIGAKVYLQTKTRKQLKEVTAGGGFQSQNSKSIVFGIDKSELTSPLKLTISWPGGKIQEQLIKGTDRYYDISEK